jgi:hypothetical protein
MSEYITQNIAPKNDKGEFHGYHEWYNIDGRLSFRCIYKNGLEVGYSEWHNTKKTLFYIR